MSIEMKNPETLVELIDAAWNHVEQIRLAVALGDAVKRDSAINAASRLLSIAVEKAEALP